LPENPAPGKNPYDGGNQTGANTGPTIEGNSPCKENDNVRGVTGMWRPGNAGQPCPPDQMLRAVCIQKIQRAMKNWSIGASKAMEKLGPIESVFGGLVKAINSINEAFNDINPPTADDCGNVNVANIRDKIAKATGAITAATNALDTLKELTDKFENEDD
jgi:hypothetical protein